MGVKEGDVMEATACHSAGVGAEQLGEGLMQT